MDDLLTHAKKFEGVTGGYGYMDGITERLPRPTRDKAKYIVKTKEWLTDNQNDIVSPFVSFFVNKNIEIQGLNVPFDAFFKTLETGTPKFIYWQTLPERWESIKNLVPKYAKIGQKQTAYRKMCVYNMSLFALMKTIYALPKAKQWHILDWLSSMQIDPESKVKSPYSLKDYQYFQNITKKIYNGD